MKRWMGLLAAVVFLLGGCGAKKTSEELVSMYDLRIAMEAADEQLPPMLNASSSEDAAAENFAHISDMDYEKVDRYFLSYSEEGLADEIAVIAVRDKADVAEAKQSLEKHKESRYKLFQQYEPEQLKRISDGIVFSEGHYAVLIICEDIPAVRKAFEELVYEE